MNQPMSYEQLSQENRNFAGTAGVSQENRSSGFHPAFCDTDTGRVELARFADGNPAPCHLLDGVPEEWIQTRSHTGRITAVKASVISGFVRASRFYTREQAARAVQ
jgi:hypothetical protein